MSLLTLFLSLISMLSVTVEDIDIEDQYIYNSMVFTYGSYVDSDNDGVLIVNDLETDEEIFNLVYDDSHHEYFKYLAVVDENEYLIVCEKYSNVDGMTMPVFLETEIIRIDGSGDIIGSLVLYEKYNGYYNHGYQLILKKSNNKLVKYNSNLEIVDFEIDEEYTKKLFLQYRGEAFIDGEYMESIDIYQPGYYQITIIESGHSFTYDMTLNPELYFIGETENEYYTGSVKIVCSSVVYVNDEIYMVNTLFDEPGIYDIKIFGENDYVYIERFVIIPTITYYTEDERNDFVDGLILNQSVTISSNAISMYLNGKIYNSEIIDEIGEYELVVYGVNQMQYRLTFYIYPSVVGLTNNYDYDSVSFIVYGQALLNGEAITGNVDVSEEGDYVLELMFEGEVFEKYYFSIVSNDMSEETGFVFNFNYVFGLVLVIGIVLFYRKK